MKRRLSEAEICSIQVKEESDEEVDIVYDQHLNEELNDIYSKVFHSSTANKELKFILMEWEMPELVDTLKEYGIVSTESLTYIEEQDLETIFGKDLGRKMKFRYKLKEWRKFNKMEELKSPLYNIESMLSDILSTLRSSAHKDTSFERFAANESHVYSPNPEQSSTSKDYDLKKYLSQKSSAFEAHLCSENNLGTLTPKGRNLIIKNAIEFYVSQDRFMGETEFLHVANEICKSFVGEDVDIYYCKNDSIPTGKLYHSYKNAVTRLRKDGLFPMKKKHKKPIPTEESTFTSHGQNDLLNDKKEWLRTHSEPWEDVHWRWVATAELRRAEIARNLNLADTLAQWPSYMMNFGKRLIDIDFECRYASVENALLEQWDNFCIDFVLRAPAIIKDTVSLNRIQNLNGNLSKDLRDAEIFDLLSALLTPTCTCKHKETKKIWRAKIKDSENHFILRLNNVDELQKRLKEMSQKLVEHNSKLQPIIVLIQTVDETEILGVYENLTYRYNSLLEAVSHVFKMHFVLHIEFQKICCFVWEFLQGYFFKIEPKKCSPRVREILNEF